MTSDEIIAKWESMTPRERDAWVAEAVMGWSVEQGRNYMYHDTDYVVRYTVGNVVLDDTPDNLKDFTGALYYHPLPHFTADIAAAWELWPHIPSHYSLDRYEDGWRMYESDPDGFYENASWAILLQPKPAPEAICLAALIAKLGARE